MRSDHPDPLWLQVAALVAEDVSTGRLGAGSRLPAERELCLRLGVSRVTLRKALSHLVEEGVLRPSHGRGWYVAATSSERKDWPNRLESFSETAARMNLTPTSRVLRSSVDPATLDEAEELGIAPGTPLFHLDRVRLLEGIPTAIDRTRVPAHVAPALAETDFTTGSLYDVLASAGAEPVRAEATIEAQASTP
ncbi:transcriptional regulator [Luteimicrobium album]|uniref:Transcriptional regulator n=1 Tax=Luteimicrobium album TaxID=1054550 RepID=A0ABQ6HZT3_9MICO|nr:transcriptional regulator [Luteimicrobium album]